MLRLGLGVLLCPFHQPAVAADLRHEQPIARRGDAVDEVVLDPEHRRRFEHVGEVVEDDLLIHRRPHADRSLGSVGGDERVLRRVRGTGNQPPGARIFDEPAETELRRLAHHRPVLLELFLVPTERVLLPQVLTKPRPGHRKEAPMRNLSRRGEAPDVVDRVDGPPACAVVNLSDRAIPVFASGGSVARADRRTRGD